MKNPTTEEILKSINELGCLFEQEVASIFEKNKCYAQSNVNLTDSHEEKIERKKCNKL